MEDFYLSDLNINLREVSIEDKIFNFSEGVRIEVKGQLKFQES